MTSTISNLQYSKDKIVIYTSHDINSMKHANNIISIETENKDEELLDSLGFGK